MEEDEKGLRFEIEFYINYEECKFLEEGENFVYFAEFYINYEECKFIGLWFPM